MTQHERALVIDHMTIRMRLFSNVNKYQVLVFKGQSVVENSKVERINKRKAIYAWALAQAFARYHDEGNIEVVYDRKEKRSYVRAAKDFYSGSLVIMPCGPAVKSRTVKYGERIGELESFIMDAEDGERIICSPMHKPFNEATVSISPS